jgi:hypothetical protein
MGKSCTWMAACSPFCETPFIFGEIITETRGGHPYALARSLAGLEAKPFRSFRASRSQKGLFAASWRRYHPGRPLLSSSGLAGPRSLRRGWQSAAVLSPSDSPFRVSGPMSRQTTRMFPRRSPGFCLNARSTPEIPPPMIRMPTRSSVVSGTPSPSGRLQPAPRASGGFPRSGAAAHARGYKSGSWRQRRPGTDNDDFR